MSSRWVPAISSAVFERAEFRAAACLFAGTETLSSAIAAPVKIN